MQEKKTRVPANWSRRSALVSLAGAPVLTTMLGAESNEQTALQDKLAADPRRPQYHFLPPAHWMNDPNGPIYWKGVYHMFYQYNPNAAVWGDMHWGHAISDDMIHWRHLQPALAPTPGLADSGGCFSGTAVINQDRVEFLYTGVRPIKESEATIRNGAHSLVETQCVAIANDDSLRTWSKLPAPVIQAPPAGLVVNGFRDPSPWRQQDWWYMVLGSGFANRGGAVLLYRSKDLRNWEYVHPLLQREPTNGAGFNPYSLSEVWECPEFFPLGNKHVLIVSTSSKVWWWSGSLEQTGMTFHPEQSGIVDYGSYYAAKTQLDKSGNRIIWGWSQETRPVQEYSASGWSGVMALPRVLSLASDGRLRMTFASEAYQLRKEETRLRLPLDEGAFQKQIAALRVKNYCAEILCEMRSSSQPFELALVDNQAKQCLSIRSGGKHAGEVSIDGQPASVSLISGGLKFHIYVDGSVIEILINNEVSYTKRLYLPGEKAAELHFTFNGSTKDIVGLTMWDLASVSNNRLTRS
jgi:beta-fructofuranosidase